MPGVANFDRFVIRASPSKDGDPSSRLTDQHHVCLCRTVDAMNDGRFDVASARRPGNQVHRCVAVAAVDVDVFEEEEFIERW